MIRQDSTPSVAQTLNRALLGEEGAQRAADEAERDRRANHVVSRCLLIRQRLYVAAVAVAVALEAAGGSAIVVWLWRGAAW